jgi:hypothetical protein
VDIRQEVLEIDLHNLTEALQNHTAWFDHYTQNLPELKRAQMEHKEEYARIGNELYLEFKKNPPEGMKVTEAALQALISTDQRYIDAHKRWMEVKQEHDSVERFRDLFERRESSLRMLVELYKAQYWGPTSGMNTPDRRPPREPLADKGDSVDLDQVKEQLAERAAENRKSWNKS